MSKKPICVGIVIGSDSDVPIVEETKKILEEFGVPFAATIRSAHRTPDDVREIVGEWENRGCKVFIAAAGAAAHLAGVIASQTIKPVIAIPLATKTQSAVNGLDALLSCVQMPAGIPVATVGVNGAANAAYLAIQILALTKRAVSPSRLLLYRTRLISKTREKADALKKAGWPD